MDVETEARCWNDIAAENERLRELLAKAVLALEIACRALGSNKEAVDALLAPYRAALEGEN